MFIDYKEFFIAVYSYLPITLFYVHLIIHFSSIVISILLVITSHKASVLTSTTVYRTSRDHPQRYQSLPPDEPD